MVSRVSTVPVARCSTRARRHWSRTAARWGPVQVKCRYQAGGFRAARSGRLSSSRRLDRAAPNGRWRRWPGRRVGRGECTRLAVDSRRGCGLRGVRRWSTTGRWSRCGTRNTPGSRSRMGAAALGRVLCLPRVAMAMTVAPARGSSDRFRGWLGDAAARGWSRPKPGGGHRLRLRQISPSLPNHDQQAAPVRSDVELRVADSSVCAEDVRAPWPAQIPASVVRKPMLYPLSYEGGEVLRIPGWAYRGVPGRP